MAREFVSVLDVKTGANAFDMTSRFENTYNKVKGMVEKQSIYSVWIRMQFGHNQPVTFNTSSRDKKENIIASLSMKKPGANAGNSFTLKVIWDPFDNGQNPVEKIQALDDIMADALQYDFHKDNNDLRGYIQYGYNYTEDNQLVSPKYSYILNKADSVTDWASGITTYTFEGVTELMLDCNLTDVTFDEIKDWKMMDLVNWILYYYYGDPDNPPLQVDKGTPTYPNSPKYKIDIPKEYFSQCNQHIDVANTPAGITPWQYCVNIMNQKDNILTQKDKDSGKYNNIDSLDVSMKPSWSLFVTDNDRTIHITHCSPLLTKDEDIKVDGKSLETNQAITWGRQKTSLVTRWSSSANMLIYLVNKTNNARSLGINLDKARQELNDLTNQYNELNSQVTQINTEISEYEKTENDLTGKTQLPGAQGTPFWDAKGNRTAYKPMTVQDFENQKTQATQRITELRNATQKKKESLDKRTQVQDNINRIKASLDEKTKRVKELEDQYSAKVREVEYFDAELTTVGIPADAPANMRLKIIPRVLESVPSRQAGLYIVKQSTDSISTNGIYETTFKLFRLRSLLDGEKE